MPASILDVFNSEAFSTISMTESINRAPFQPGRIGAMGLFEEEGVPDNTVVIERQQDHLSILPAKARGAEGSKPRHSKRDVKSFTIPHIPHDDEVLAAEVQSVRPFGKEAGTVDAVSAVVARRLAMMRANHETTHEYQRARALAGIVLDADGSTELLNMWDEFGYTATNYEVDFVLGTSTTDIKSKCVEVRRGIEDNLGAATHTGIIAVCGNTFWDAFIAHDIVKAAYDRPQDGRFLRTDQRAPAVPASQGMSANPPVVDRFEFGGILWENYRGAIGSRAFVTAGDARFVVTGVQGLYKAFFGPADFVEAVNTMGKSFYAKQERMKFDRGVEIHTQSNPLFVCTRPNVLWRGYSSN